MGTHAEDWKNLASAAANGLRGVYGAASDAVQNGASAVQQKIRGLSGSNVQSETPAPQAATAASAPPPPSGGTPTTTASAVEKPGILNKVWNGTKMVGKVGGGVLAAGMEAARAADDIKSAPGVTGIDAVARVGEGASRAGGAYLGMEGGAALGAPLGPLGMAVGGLAGGAAGYFLPDAANAISNYVRGTNDKLPSESMQGKREAAAAKVAAVRAQNMQTSQGAKNTPASAGVQVPPTTTQGSVGVAEQPIAQPGIARAASLAEDKLLQSLQKDYENAQRRHAEYGLVGTAQTLKEARDALISYVNGNQRVGLERELGTARNDIERTRVNNEVELRRLDRQRAYAELSDKRMKDFNEQFTKNAFYKDKLNDKGVAVGKEADDEKNARFLDYMRSAPSEFYRKYGVDSYETFTTSQMSDEQRNKLIAELRKSFLEKEAVDESSSKNEWFRKAGMSNAPLQIGKPRESQVGDIPQIGLRNYLWDSLKQHTFGNGDVVEVTDPSTGLRKVVPATEFIGEGTEGSGDRYSKLYSK